MFDDNATKHSQHSQHHFSRTPTKHSNQTDFNVSDLTPDLSKNLSDLVTSAKPGSGDNDDSFIVFAHSEDHKSGHSEARKDTSLDKRLERVKELDGYTKTESSNYTKKKKVSYYFFYYLLYK